MDDTLVLAPSTTLPPAQKQRVRVKQHHTQSAPITSLQLAKISFEMRTFLNSITGIAQILQFDKQLSQEEIHDCINSIYQTSNDLLSLTDDILDFTNLEQNQFNISLSNINLQQTIEQTIRQFTLHAKQKDLDLIVNYSPDAPMLVRGNAHRIRQILAHLLENALKFTDKGQITITLGDTTDIKRNHFAKISIKDTGIGIAAEQLPTLFSEYTLAPDQKDNHFIHKYPGIGFGLIIVKQLIKHMGGDITVNSEEGKGSEFIFTLPIVTEEAIEQELQELKQQVTGLRVLVISDDQQRCVSLQEQLTSWGIVSDHTSLKEALNILRSAHDNHTPWQVAIISSPSVDQHTAYFARTLKANGLFKHLLLLLAPPTALHGYEMDQAYSSGFTGVLTPLQPTNLIKELQQAWEAWPEKVYSVTSTMPLKKHFVLVVEDNEINQKVAKLLLGELNCQVDIAENGQTALTSLQKNRYDLVFMDIGLPDMSGIEVTSQLRQRENVAHRVPVIALTADCLSGDEETWAKVGIDDYLIKPYTLEQLEEMIEKWAKKEGKR